MKSFLKTFFSSCLGVIGGLGCLGFLLVVFLGGSLASFSFGGGSDEMREVSSNTILKIDVQKISELVQQDFQSMVDELQNEASSSISLLDAKKAIKKAKANPNVKGILLEIGGISSGMPILDELKRALKDFSKSGKPIYAYGDSYGQKDYFLCSVSDKIVLNPVGSVGLMGIASGTVLFKKALDKLGLKMNVFKVGTYKAAVEPFIKEHISPENSQQITEYITGLWDYIIKSIAADRQIDPEQLKNWVNEGLAFEEGAIFQERKLVDTLLYRRDMVDFIAQDLSSRTGEELKAEDLKEISLDQMARSVEGLKAEHSENKVQLIIAEGEINEFANSQPFNKQSVIDYSLVDQLVEARDNDDVKAVVLRVNSPGGSAFLSEQIWAAVKSLKEKKKIVISMGNYAASGGYYISSAADFIYAEPTTLTGSIGIFGMMLNASELASHLGVSLDVVKTSKYAGMGVGLPVNPMSSEEKAQIQKVVERGYKLFLSRVSEGRNMSIEAVDAVGQGRIWLGTKAKELGLVDGLGGIDDAILKAVELAELPDYEVLYPNTTKSFLETMLEVKDNHLTASISSSFLSEEEQKVLSYLKKNASYFGVHARLPYEIIAY